VIDKRFNVNLLKLPRMTTVDIMGKFGVDLETAIMFHNAIMADYYTVVLNASIKFEPIAEKE